MKLTKISVLVCSMTLLATALAAGAATIRVQCEKRSDRSKISVDGKDLVPGDYQAQVMSEWNTAESTIQSSVGDEVEFDFSSRRRDIAEGATSISANFIQGGSVTGKILDADGMTVIADIVNCRVRD